MGAECYMTGSMLSARSSQVQKIMIGRNADIDRMKAIAKRLCRISEERNGDYRIIENDTTAKKMKGENTWILS